MNIVKDIANEFYDGHFRICPSTLTNRDEICDLKDLNAYEFDIVKRVARCRKKGNFIEDLERTKIVIDLYIQEYGH